MGGLAKQRNMRRWHNIVVMLGQRRRRWPNIQTTLGKRLMLAAKQEKTSQD